MEKRINKMNAMIGAGINVNATQANNVSKSETVEDKKSNGYEIAVKADLKDPEVTGSDTFDMELTFPFGGGLKIKATSTVTSSVQAQEVLNEQARKNLETLGQFLASAAMAIAPAITQIQGAIREQDALENEASDKRQREAEELCNELNKMREENEHERELARIKRNHEKRMLELNLDAEYNQIRYPEQNED